MNGRIFFWSLTSALAGFLFGFDTVVISGAEKTIQTLWGLSPGLHGIAMASALYGTVVGSLLGGWPADRFGRKATLLWIGILYLVGAVGSALAPNVAVFIAARVIGGLGIGISTVVAPMYISEWLLRPSPFCSSHPMRMPSAGREILPVIVLGRPMSVPGSRLLKDAAFTSLVA